MSTEPVLEPYAASAPPGSRALGVAPFLAPGDALMWRPEPAWTAPPLGPHERWVVDLLD